MKLEDIAEINIGCVLEDELRWIYGLGGKKDE